ncbi:MAG: WYL domain-containing protein [Lentisphaeria bacterium]|nr:WYL domain-containing protein [Lentisphaeria bacterium]
MARIVALLKQGDLTMKDILEDLEDSTMRGTTDISCASRTVRRDIEILKREYHCPLEYARSGHCYTLHTKNSARTMPAVLNNSELLAIVIGGKFSKDILPPSTSRSVEDAVDEIIRSNSTTEFLSSGRLKALKILSNTGETISDDVFNVIFEAWRTCHRLLIDYRNSKDERSQHVIEPHALVFYDMQWSIRAFCPDKRKWLTFLASRIDRAYSQEERFTPSQKEIDSISPDNYYNFPSAGNVRIRLTRSGLQFAKAHPLRSNQTITARDMDTYILTATDISTEEMLRWTLSQVPGDAIPIAPQRMVDTIKEALDKMKTLCENFQE